MNLGWLHQDGFRYDWKVQGYKPDSRTFGAKAGPQSSVTDLIHEVSHGIVCALDGELWRLERYSYGLTVRQVEVLGQLCVEPLTGQATALECRVIGIQKAIQDDLGIPSEGFYHRYVKSLHFMPDWIFFGGRNRHRRRTRHLPANQRKLDWPRERRLYSLICKKEAEAKDHFDDLVKAWKEVCDYNRKALQ